MRADMRPPIDDDLARLLRAADPARGADQPDPDEPAAQRVLAAAKRSRYRPTKRPGRRRLVVACALIAVATTAASYQLLFDWDGRAGDSNGVDCVASGQAEGRAPFVAGVDDPVRSCRQVWPEHFGTAAPTELTACVDGSRQGSIKVYPGGRGVCAAHDATPYRGPTAEQLRLVGFRRELAALARTASCVSYAQLRQATDTALTRHRLDGWRIVDYANTDRPARRDGCASLYVDEPRHELVLAGGGTTSAVD